MSFVEQNGKIQLALRSPTEKKNEQIKASTWKTLADYILQNQGADINVPDDLMGKQEIKQQEPAAKPSIQIFRGGKEL